MDAVNFSSFSVGWKGRKRYSKAYDSQINALKGKYSLKSKYSSLNELMRETSAWHVPV